GCLKKEQMVVSAIASTPQVAAFALPATCRPEGYLAAQRNGTLIQVAPQQTRTFTVTTGIE
ncbi:hypothetical protein HEN31_024465, partial [Escherichia coli]|nr:hypothetical protein [Escherichia coli]MBC0503665.1 hypothetical protein [Escherichia coli]